MHHALYDGVSMRLFFDQVEAAYHDDVVFGVTVNGRSALVPGIERMAGPTIATFPLRVRLDTSTTIETCLYMLQDNITELVLYKQTGLQNIRRYSRECAAACDF
ncbi:hypothetical protein EYZ11_012324 [Aspergillus tanneri]|uniref:Condensation domain-containing protein n=1 Tax=Aspergillus tanneri TaxID=1220188 RepID=A0A4S3J2M6_9EURO|nr:hypothetical protein EYZ11_012324 [Aspergillus tanneri]